MRCSTAARAQRVSASATRRAQTLPTRRATLKIARHAGTQRHHFAYWKSCSWSWPRRYPTESEGIYLPLPATVSSLTYQRCRARPILRDWPKPGCARWISVKSVSGSNARFWIPVQGLCDPVCPAPSPRRLCSRRTPLQGPARSSCRIQVFRLLDGSSTTKLPAE